MKIKGIKMKVKRKEEKSKIHLVNPEVPEGLGYSQGLKGKKRGSREEMGGQLRPCFSHSFLWDCFNSTIISLKLV